MTMHLLKGIFTIKIVAAFREMHVSPAKHSFGKCDRKVWQTDGQTDDGQSDPHVSLCLATQKWQNLRLVTMVPFFLSLITSLITVKLYGIHKSSLWYCDREIVTTYLSYNCTITSLAWDSSRFSQVIRHFLRSYAARKQLRVWIIHEKRQKLIHLYPPKSFVPLISGAPVSAAS